MVAPGDAPWVRVVDDGTPAVRVAGSPRCSLGHRLAGGAHGADGVFADWRVEGDRLVVETDRYGMYPLFVHATRREVMVSPSIPRLLELGAPADLDLDALAVFLHVGFFIRDETPFRAIRALPPGARLVWTRDGLALEGAPFLRAPIAIDYDAAVDAYADLFRRAMRRRPPAGRVAVPLSGGRDSRHILLELLASGRTPDACVTARYFPPRPDEDAAVAPRLAAALGVPHVLLDQGDELQAEAAKNVATSFCADEHAWYLVVAAYLAGFDTVYDGIAGDVLSAGLFLTRDRVEKQERGRYDELAEAFLKPRYDRTLAALLAGDVRPRLARARARERVAVELRAHAGAANPIGSFCFWNRTRREIALSPWALGPASATVYAPYLDHELYDFLSTLPAAMLVDRRFHTAAIARAYPEWAELPYEDPNAVYGDAREQDRCFARALVRSRWGSGGGRSALLAPGFRRRVWWAAQLWSGWRGADARLEPRLALYLRQIAELSAAR